MTKGRLRSKAYALKLELECAENDVEAAEDYFNKVNETLAGAVNNLQRAQRRLEAARSAFAEYVTPKEEGK